MKILFVCTGNICRSPTAEGVARRWLAMSGLEEVVGVDSAGTQGYHTGEAPDPRAQTAALRRGYDLSQQRAQQVRAQDFERYDLILAMDRQNLHDLQQLAHRVPAGQRRARLALYLEQAGPQHGDEVPDPYYGGAAGFEQVLEACEQGAQGWLRHWRTGEKK